MEESVEYKKRAIYGLSNCLNYPIPIQKWREEWRQSTQRQLFQQEIVYSKSFNQIPFLRCCH